MNKKKVFSLALFYYWCLKNNTSIKIIKKCMHWANKCHGKEVINSKCENCLVLNEWCKEV